MARPYGFYKPAQEQQVTASKIDITPAEAELKMEFVRKELEHFAALFAIRSSNPLNAEYYKNCLIAEEKISEAQAGRGLEQNAPTI